MTDTSTAPERIWIHHAGLIKADGTQCLVFLTSAPANFQDTQTNYVREDLYVALLVERDELEAELASGSFYKESDIDALQERADNTEAAVKRALEAAQAQQREIAEAWPPVLSLIRGYDESFPYANLDGDDEKVTRMEEAVRRIVEGGE